MINRNKKCLVSKIKWNINKNSKKLSHQHQQEDDLKAVIDEPQVLYNFYLLFLKSRVDLKKLRETEMHKYSDNKLEECN